VGASAASNSLNGTPSVVPGAPTITSVTAPSAGVLEVAFSPGYIGGSAITDYEYALSAGENTSAFGAYTSVGSTASPFSISGLEPGSAYTVALRAINAAGTGPSSAYQSGVTLDAPDAPIIASVSGGDGRIAVAYTAYDLDTNGGSALSGVEYSVDAGSTWVLLEPWLPLSLFWASPMESPTGLFFEPPTPSGPQLFKLSICYASICCIVPKICGYSKRPG